MMMFFSCFRKRSQWVETILYQLVLSRIWTI